MCSRVILVISLVILAVTANPPVPDTFINNGAEARIQDFPHILSLRRNGVHVGGGAIISPNWALSAAHILLGCPPSQLTLRAGSAERLLGGALHNAHQITIHNQFNPFNLNNNIAIIGVLEPFTFSATISAVSLDIQGNKIIQK